LVLGAGVPIALTSRADGPAARVSSALLALVAGHAQRCKSQDLQHAREKFNTP
jgi:phosphate acetyltransferase